MKGICADVRICECADSIIRGEYSEMRYVQLKAFAHRLFIVMRVMHKPSIFCKPVL